MESMVVKYSIRVTSIVWRLIASVVFFWSIFQVLSYKFVVLAFYVVGLAYFSHQVLWLLWKSIPCTKTLVHRKETTMAKSKITERDGQIVFQGIEYTVDQWAMKKKAEADVEARQKELAEQRKKPVSIPSKIRLFLWIVIAIITAPFALVLAVSSWLQDLVAGDQCPWEKMRGAVPDLTDGLSSEAVVANYATTESWGSTPTVASTASEISLETLTAAPTEEKKDD